MTHRPAPAAPTRNSAHVTRTPIRDFLQILTTGRPSTDQPLPLVTPNGATLWALPVSGDRPAAIPLRLKLTRGPRRAGLSDHLLNQAPAHDTQSAAILEVATSTEIATPTPSGTATAAWPPALRPEALEHDHRHHPE